MFRSFFLVWCCLGWLGLFTTTANSEPIENYRLEKIWSIEDDGKQHFLFGILEDVLIDDSGLVFILDSQTSNVKVFSPEGKYIASYGGQGEGPGEFRNPGSLVTMPDSSLGVVSKGLAKIIKLGTETGYSRGNVYAEGVEGGPALFGCVQSHPSFSNDGFVAVVREMTPVSWDKKRGIWWGRSYLASFENSTQEMHSYPLSIFAEVGEMAGTSEEEEEYFWLWRPWAIDSLGRIVMAPYWGKYQLQYYDFAGKLVQETSFPFEQRARTEIEKSRCLNLVWGGVDPEAMGVELHLSKSEAIVREIIPREDGVVWIRTNRSGIKNPAGVLLELDAVAPTGEQRKKIRIIGSGDAGLDRLFFGPNNRVIHIRNGEGFIRNARGRAQSDEVYDLEIIAYNLVKED